jgi:hypothetical protein
MNIHKNARLTMLGRERLAQAVLRGQTPKAAATTPPKRDIRFLCGPAATADLP